jgi:LuxR family maltose regulon positive regulatory protein
MALARTLLAGGDVTAAELALERALQAARQLGSPAYIAQVHAAQTRLALARGDLAAAQRWQMAITPDLADERGAAREVEALTLARVLIAQGRQSSGGAALHAAHMLLERLRQDAATHGRTGSLIEMLVLTALTDAAAGHREQALKVLQQALLLAMPEGYMRIFLDEGAPMADLLRRMKAEGGRMKQYIQKLLAAFGTGESPHPLVEPLSERELEVLRLIASGAPNQVIAAELVISIGTVKSHINHILGKLAARNRTEAVSRGRALGLLAS